MGRQRQRTQVADRLVGTSRPRSTNHQEPHLKVARILALLAACLAMGSCASDEQDRLVATELGPIPQPPPLSSPLPAPDPSRGEAVAWLKNHYIYAGDLGAGELRGRIMIPLFEDYIREHHLEPTQAQVASFHHFNRDVHEEPRFDPPSGSLFDRAFDALVGAAAKRTVAQVMVRQWLLDKSLYEKYGGRVIFQQANPNEPVGAYRAFLAGHERRGTFRILDLKRRDEFWSYFTSKHSMELSKDQIDFSRPWWEKPPGRD